MTEHTPEPWEIKAYPYRKNGQNYSRAGVISKDGFWVATEICGHKHDDSAWANARLIAAAPDLLEALEELADWHERPIPRGYTLDTWMYECATKARTAIAKAKEER